MTASFLSHIDWSRPWLASFRDIAAPIVPAADWRLALNAAAEARALRNHRDLPVRFVPQAELPAGIAYESYISETGCVPTRDNLHDFFNALVWLRYPLTKARLNALQAAAIAEAGTVAVRGRLRDAITIFDENAALFVTHDEKFIAALRDHQWEILFLEERAAFGRQYSVHLFGHALMEKLVMPYKAITAHAWPMRVVFHPEQGLQDQVGALDNMVSSTLSGELHTSALMPLPVLGLPGWDAAQDEAYYRDTHVFRPARSKAGLPKG